MSAVRKTATRPLGLASLMAIVLSTAACSGAAFEECVERPMAPGTARQGFELIDVPTGQVWLTRDWELEEFQSFSLPVSWSLWRKNDPRTGAASRGAFLRSPGCALGEFTYMRAHGREFLHVVNLQNFGEEPDGTDGLIRDVSLNKHHSITYDEGGPIEVLTNPEGERFVLVARTLEDAPEIPTLPDGWTVTRAQLAAPFTFDLDGEVSVLRMDNEDSFQGPVPDDVSIPLIE
ncbi:MAG: hypothetical protein AAFZ11_04010 [Pseudomonadota bacterium]